MRFLIWVSYPVILGGHQNLLVDLQPASIPTIQQTGSIGAVAMAFKLRIALYGR